MLDRALLLLAPTFEWAYGGDPPSVYGWADPDVDPGPEGSAPARYSLLASRGATQGDSLGGVWNGAALQPVLLQLQAEFADVFLAAYHDDPAAVLPANNLVTFMRRVAEFGAEVDAELAPAKCVAWSPTPRPSLTGFSARWATEGVLQFSVPLVSPAFIASAVDKLATDRRGLDDAILSLPPAELQAQLLLLRCCEGPRLYYWLRALPLEWGRCLETAVEVTSIGDLLTILCFAADTTVTRAAVLARVSLPASMGGLGVGGRSHVVAAASLASWLDALGPGAVHSRAIRAVCASVQRADPSPCPPPPATPLPPPQPRAGPRRPSPPTLEQAGAPPPLRRAPAQPTAAVPPPPPPPCPPPASVPPAPVRTPRRRSPPPPARRQPRLRRTP